jgi:hypothetical protein
MVDFRNVATAVQRMLLAAVARATHVLIVTPSFVVITTWVELRLTELTEKDELAERHKIVDMGAGKLPPWTNGGHRKLQGFLGA